MVVDDDKSVRELFTYALEFAGYVVTTAENGLAALNLLRRDPRPSLVILDMEMPLMTGRQFLDEIAKFEKYSSHRCFRHGKFYRCSWSQETD